MSKDPLAVLSKRDLDVATFAGNDSGRPMLTHVLARKKDGKVQLIATDSYAAVVTDISAIELPEFEQFLIPATALLMAKKVVGKHEVYTHRRTRKADDHVHLYADRIEIPEQNITIAIKTEDDASKYPDLDKLIKNIDRTNSADVTLNSKLLERATKFVGSDPAGSGSNACNIKINAKLAPVEITNGNTYALVMPLKS